VHSIGADRDMRGPNETLSTQSRCGKSAQLRNIIAVRRRAGGDVARSWSFVPAIMRNLVVLPQADGPRRQQ